MAGRGAEGRAEKRQPGRVDLVPNVGIKTQI